MYRIWVVICQLVNMAVDLPIGRIAAAERGELCGSENILGNGDVAECANMDWLALHAVRWS